MGPVRVIKAQCSHAEFMRTLPNAVNFRPYEIIDNQVIVHDENKLINITIHDEPIKTLGSLKLPMEEIRFEFQGYNEDDADIFMKNYRAHNLKCGGG